MEWVCPECGTLNGYDETEVMIQILMPERDYCKKCGHENGG